jgi:uncharacterized protein (TIGR02599 family)
MRSSLPRKTRRRRLGLTVVEILVAISVLLLIFITVAQFCAEVDRSWKSAADDPFAEAREAFETVARNLASATLEPYEDYADATGAFRGTGTFTPDHLARRSDLDFVCGPASGTGGLLGTTGRVTSGSAIFFVMPQGETQSDAGEGLGHLLNAMGYFVEFSDDEATPAFALSLSHRWRWRLRQVDQPSESLQVFATTTSSAWLQQLVPAGTNYPTLAENVISLVAEPERAAGDTGAPLAPGYAYDSRDATGTLTFNQLPPRLKLVLCAIDETSAERLAALNGAQPPPLVASSLFQQAAQLSSDLATLDASLTASRIGHRIFQRDIELTAAAWSNVSP